MKLYWSIRKFAITDSICSERVKSSTHVFCVHDIATLPDRSDSLVGVDPQSVNSRGNSPRFAVASTRVRRDVELDTIWNADFTSVTCKEPTLTLKVKCHHATLHHVKYVQASRNELLYKLEFHLSCANLGPAYSTPSSKYFFDGQIYCTWSG
jgi:hypothetical protein